MPEGRRQARMRNNPRSRRCRPSCHETSGRAMKPAPSKPSAEAVVAPALELRQRAEDLALRDAAREAEPVAGMSSEDARRTLHELRVCRIQLEMQQDELRRTQAALRESELRYQRITPCKPAEEVLQASRDYLKAVLDATADAIFVEDPASGRILDVNRSMCEMYGYTHDEALQVRIGDLSEGSTPYSQADAMVMLEKARTLGPQVFEWLGKRKNGEIFWAEVCVRFTTLGSAERLVVSVRDIGERKQVEESLKQKYAELERFNRVTVGREMRMIELKQEINGLLQAAGQLEKYRIVDDQV